MLLVRLMESFKIIAAINLGKLQIFAHQSTAPAEQPICPKHVIHPTTLSILPKGAILFSPPPPCCKTIFFLPTPFSMATEIRWLQCMTFAKMLDFPLCPNSLFVTRCLCFVSKFGVCIATHPPSSNLSLCGRHLLEPPYSAPLRPPATLKFRVDRPRINSECDFYTCRLTQLFVHFLNTAASRSAAHLYM